VPVAALGLALGAAVVHAFWNLLLARADDAQAATAVALTVAVVVTAPIALVLGDLPGSALPYAAASAVLELAYFALLATAYRVGELSVTYPLARGLAPVLLVLAGAVAGIGGSVGAVQIGGVVLVGAGIMAVRGLRARGGGLELALAAGVACCIAGYTLVDRTGVRDADPVTYLWVVLAIATPPYVLGMGRLRGRAALRAEASPTMAIAGIAIFAAYVLALAALKLASAAAVGAVRETSVVIVTAFAAVVLHERVTAARWAGAAAVTVGIVLIALG
jgi:drug/metabolite transporter (DMT)-like permease